MKFYIGSGIKNCELVNYYAKILKDNKPIISVAPNSFSIKLPKIVYTE